MGRKLTAVERYDRSPRGRTVRRRWRRNNRPRLAANARRYRERLALLRKQGENIRTRFPELAPGDGAAVGDGTEAASAESTPVGAVRGDGRSTDASAAAGRPTTSRRD